MLHKSWLSQDHGPRLEFCSVPSNCFEYSRFSFLTHICHSVLSWMLCVNPLQISWVLLLCSDLFFTLFWELQLPWCPQTLSCVSTIQQSPWKPAWCSPLPTSLFGSSLKPVNWGNRKNYLNCLSLKYLSFPDAWFLWNHSFMCFISYYCILIGIVCPVQLCLGDIMSSVSHYCNKVSFTIKWAAQFVSFSEHITVIFTLKPILSVQ